MLGGDYKAQIEELTDLQAANKDPIGAEKRAISFSDAVAMSIDEDDYLLKHPTPINDPDGNYGLGAICGVEAIPTIEPPSKFVAIFRYI